MHFWIKDKMSETGRPLKPLLELISEEKEMTGRTKTPAKLRVAQRSKPVGNLQSGYYFLAEKQFRQTESVCEGVNNMHRIKIPTVWLLTCSFFTFIIKVFVLSVCFLEALFPIA